MHEQLAKLEAEALRRGERPVAPVWTGWWVAIGGGLGAIAGLWSAPLRALAIAGFSGSEAVWRHTSAVLWTVLGATTAGALAGLVVAQITLGAWAPSWRLTLHPSAPPRRLGLSGLLAVSAVAGLLPLLVGEGHEDLGSLVIHASLTGWGLGALGTLTLALIKRARARARWLLKIAPKTQ